MRRPATRVALCLLAALALVITPARARLLAPAPRPRAASDAAGAWVAPTLAIAGFTQLEDQAQVVLRAANDNDDVAAGDLVYEVVALGDGDAWLGFTQSLVWMLMPGERTPVVVSLTLESAAPVRRVEARLKSWQAVPRAPLAVDAVSLAADGTARAVVHNPHRAPVQNVRVTAVAYAADDSLAGSGVAFIGNLPTGEAAPVAISLTLTQPPVRVEVSALLTSRSTVR